MRNYSLDVPHFSRKWHFFRREKAGMSMLLTALLLVGLAGVFASPGFRDGTVLFANNGQITGSNKTENVGNHIRTAQEAEALALSYYAKKYGDRDVSVEVAPGEDNSRAAYVAYIRKNGVLVKKLSIYGNKVIEEHTGIHDWIFDLLTNVN